jgi:hypothetical protein
MAGLTRVKRGRAEQVVLVVEDIHGWWCVRAKAEGPATLHVSGLENSS